MGGTLIWILAVVLALLFVLAIGLLWRCSRSYRRARRLLSAASLAEALAEAIATLDFEKEAVRQLEQTWHRTRTQQAFLHIVRNFRDYESYLPSTLKVRHRRRPHTRVCPYYRRTTPALPRPPPPKKKRHCCATFVRSGGHPPPPPPRADRHSTRRTSCAQR